jgi:adenylylsulfate kinase
MVHEVAVTSVLILTGPVGVGKSAVAGQISYLLGEMGAAYAVIDMDWLRNCYPAPVHDPFHTALGLQNLAQVSRNYRAAGAERLILVDIVETRSALSTFRDAIPGADFLVVRLSATLPTILHRLEGRETGGSLRWHQHRAAELAVLMEEEGVEDLLVETEGKTVVDVARDLLAQIGWAGTTEP